MGFSMIYLGTTYTRLRKKSTGWHFFLLLHTRILWEDKLLKFIDIVFISGIAQEFLYCCPSVRRYYYILYTIQQYNLEYFKFLLVAIFNIILYTLYAKKRMQSLVMNDFQEIMFKFLARWSQVFLSYLSLNDMITNFQSDMHQIRLDSFWKIVLHTI